MNRERSSVLSEVPPAKPVEGDSLASARALLGSAHQELVSADAWRLLEAYERIDRVYDEFPELELEYPRERLAEELRCTADALSDAAAVPLLMFCAALAPSSASCVSALLLRIARSAQDQALASVARVLAQAHDFTWDDIAPAVEQLQQRGRTHAVLGILSEVLGRLRLGPHVGSFELGNVLKDLLIEGDGREDVDPSLLAGVAWSARNRLREPTRRHAQSGRNEVLLALAEGVSRKLSAPALVSRTSPPRLAWRSQWLSFAEFAAQWRIVSGIAVDWLPTMRVGDAGDRIDGMLRAKPGHKGHIVYGPYFQLPPGAYHVCALLDSGQSWRSRYRREPVATLEAVANEGNAYLAQRDITPEDLRRGRHEFTFAVTEAAATRGQNIVEVRLWTSGAVPFSVSSITVERLPL